MEQNIELGLITPSENRENPDRIEVCAESTVEPNQRYFLFDFVKQKKF